jgi:hypothetical protein
MALKTAEALFKQYGKKFVELELVAPDYLGITDKKTLSKMAHRNDLGGIKAFRLRGNGSPWLVDIEQLASVLEQKARN